MQTSAVSPVSKGGAAGSPFAVQTHDSSKAYEEYVNPQWVSLLNLNAAYTECRGEELRAHCA